MRFRTNENRMRSESFGEVALGKREIINLPTWIPVEVYDRFGESHDTGGGDCAIDLGMKSQQPGKERNQESDRGRTNVPGGNPKQNDAVDHDLYNDENRPNLAKKKVRTP